MVTVIAGTPRRKRAEVLLLLQPSTSRNEGCCCDRDPVAALLPDGAGITNPAAGVVGAPARRERDDEVALAGPKSRRQASTPHVRDLCRLRISGNNDCSSSLPPCLPAATAAMLLVDTGLVRCFSKTPSVRQSRSTPPTAMAGTLKLTFPRVSSLFV